MNVAFWISFAAQVVSAIIVLVIVFWIARWTIGNDQLVTVPDEADEQTSVVVVPGVKSTKDDESIFITTPVANKLNRKLPFVYLSPSLDRDGGAQFTYSFWFKTEPGSNFDTVLFMRGDKTRASFQNTRPDAIDRTIKHPVAFCPMIRAKMESDGDLTFTSQVNVNDDFNKVATHTVKNESAVDVTQWNLVCVTYVDGELHGQERGVMCKIWYNLIPKQMFFQGSSIKANGGNLYVVPEFSSSDGGRAYPKTSHTNGKGSMRNLTYHNWAFDSNDVHDLMAKQSEALNKPYIQKADSGNADFMRASLSMHEQHIY